MGDREYDCDEERGRKPQSLLLFAIMINLHNFNFSLAPRVARRTTERGLAFIIYDLFSQCTSRDITLKKLFPLIFFFFTYRMY